jgi:hypothetical protein
MDSRCSGALEPDTSASEIDECGPSLARPYMLERHWPSAPEENENESDQRLLA